MPPEPVPADPGWDEDLAWLDRDPMTAAEREAWLDRLCQLDDDPCDGPQEYRDPEASAPPPGQDELTEQELAGAAEAAADEMLALDAASTGRRGPGQAGSARRFPGESDSRAAGFGTGMAWDVTPGCPQLAVAADAAADGGGPGDSFRGVADHELAGLVCAWDRLEAHMAARKLIAIAEIFRRNPEDGFEPEPGQMPAVVHEFTRDQLACALGESRAAADWLLTVAWHLATRLGATLGALADGEITRGKAEQSRLWRSRACQPGLSGAPGSGSGGVFEQVPVPDHPGGGTCPPGDGPEWGGVTLVGCHLGLDGFGRAVADGVLDHLGDEVAAIGGGQLVAVQEVAQLGGAGGGIGQVLALGDVVVVELRVQLGGGGDLVEPVGRPAVGQSMKATGRPSRATMFQGPVSR